MTLDRIDPEGPYSPENCRWATHTEQRINQSDAGKERQRLAASLAASDKWAKWRETKPVKTHCLKGHEYTQDTTYVRPNGLWECRECMRIKALEKARAKGVPERNLKAPYRKRSHHHPEFQSDASSALSGRRRA